MKNSLPIDLTFNQLLSIIKQLPNKQKVLLTKELEKDVIDSRLSNLLKTFKSDEVDQETIESEVEIVRQELYDKQKH